MLRHLLKTGDLTYRSECNAVLTTTLSELAFRDCRKEYTNLRILAANEDILLATKSVVTHFTILVHTTGSKVIAGTQRHDQSGL